MKFSEQGDLQEQPIHHQPIGGDGGPRAESEDCSDGANGQHQPPVADEVGNGKKEFGGSGYFKTIHADQRVDETRDHEGHEDRDRSHQQGEDHAGIDGGASDFAPQFNGAVEQIGQLHQHFIHAARGIGGTHHAHHHVVKRRAPRLCRCPQGFAGFDFFDQVGKDGGLSLVGGLFSHHGEGLHQGQTRINGRGQITNKCRQLSLVQRRSRTGLLFVLAL